MHTQEQKISDASASKVENFGIGYCISRRGLFIRFFLGCSGYSIANLFFSFAVTVGIIAVCMVLVVATARARRALSMNFEGILNEKLQPPQRSFTLHDAAINSINHYVIKKSHERSKGSGEA